jgi:hypothetical protein
MGMYGKKLTIMELPCRELTEENAIQYLKCKPKLTSIRFPNDDTITSVDVANAIIENVPDVEELDYTITYKQFDDESLQAMKLLFEKANSLKSLKLPMNVPEPAIRWIFDILGDRLESINFTANFFLKDETLQ